MNEDYLWDRSGPPDPEIENLEKALAPLRYQHRAEVARLADARTEPRPRWWAAAAAAALLIGVASWQMRMLPTTHVTGWTVASLEGSARMGDDAAALDMRVRAGETLRTSSASQITLQADEMGRIDLGPESQIRAANNRQLTLERGQLHAFIWARPRQFVVDTPSARAVDLGCEYTINVDPSGDGLLKVSLGWVAFQNAGKESFIPAGAQCVTRKRSGPGIPFYEDASEDLTRAVGRFERGDEASLGTILAAARPRDGLTLWHLLTRVPESERGLVFDRFAQLVSLPADLRRDAVIHEDRQAIDMCWNALNLENTDWWRGWERKWKQ